MDGTEPAESLESSFQSGIRVFLAPRLPNPRRLLDSVYVVSVVYLEQLQQTVREQLDKPSGFELNSHLVTLALESERRVGVNQFSFHPTDAISLDEEFLFSIEFTFLNSSFNRTQRRVQCGEIPSGARRDFTNLERTENCQFLYTNRSGVSVPSCECLRTGTYGLLVSRPSHVQEGVLVSGVSIPVVYGCLISLILSILTWGLLIKTYLQTGSKLIVNLKVRSLKFGADIQPIGLVLLIQFFFL